MTTRVSIRLHHTPISRFIVPASLVAVLVASLAYLIGGTARAAPFDERPTSADTAVSMAVRQYYLTTSAYDGSAADGAGVCANGYHFASIWEILDPSRLRYDTDLGSARADSGSGPPTGLVGWVRTGNDAGIDPTPGTGNCSTWSSANPGDEGTCVSLPTDWTASASGVHVWVAATSDCSLARPVWCVSDALVVSVYIPLILRS